MQRRSFIASGLTLAASQAALAQSGMPALITRATDTLMPKGKGQRVVILGGDWGGLNAAKQLRQVAPDLEVVVLERKDGLSCDGSRIAITGCGKQVTNDCHGSTWTRSSQVEPYR